MTGIVAVSNGGTGWNAITANTVLLGNGTGAISTTSAGTNGQVLALVSGVPTWVATSSINNGVSSLAQTFGTAQTGAVTFATSSQTTNGQTTGLTITNTAGAFTFAPTLSGTLTVGGGGTGQTTFASGQLLYGNGTHALSSVATGTVASGAGISVTGGQSIIGSGLTITNTGVTSLAGTANQITASAGTGAVTLSIPTQFNISNASTTNLSANTLAVGGTGTTSISSTGSLSTPSLSIGSLAGVLYGTAGQSTPSPPPPLHQTPNSPPPAPSVPLSAAPTQRSHLRPTVLHSPSSHKSQPTPSSATQPEPPATSRRFPLEH